MFGSRGNPHGSENSAAVRDSYAIQREEMIELQLRRRGVVRHSVLDAMRAVPRHLFVAHQHTAHAYADQALPSQDGQTISQPFMVAVMTQELDLKRGQRVLELGTGTGYQTAILAHLVNGGDAQEPASGGVYTIERIAELSASAQSRLEVMGVRGVHFFIGDGSAGWPADDPAWDGPRSADGMPLFDRILVTAGAPKVPEPLKHQLADGGVMLLPIGSGDAQTLIRVERHGGQYKMIEVMECRFVPLVGAHAWAKEAAEAMGGNAASGIDNK